MISINLNNKENLKLTPIFVKNRIPYIRNENNGCITIALPEKRIPQYKILNKSAVEFSDLMDGTNTVQMILDLLAKKYGENHRTAITADMGIVLSTFLSLKLIIFKKGEFPTMDGITMPLNDKLVVKFAFEHDLNNIVLALDSVKTSDNFTFSSPLAYNAIPNLLQLRSSVFELGKIYFLLLDDTETIRGIAEFETSAISRYITNSVAILSYVSCPSKNLDEFVKGCASLINKVALCSTTKIRTYIPVDQPEAIESFSHSGFEKAAFLKEEYGKIDVCMMDYFV